MTEEQIQKIIDGDRASFKVLVDEYQLFVKRICYNYLRNLEDAEDISQETFVTIYKTIKSFRKESELSTWIYRIAISKCIDHTRKIKSKKRLGLVKKIIGLEKETAKKIPSQEINPEINFEINERNEILVWALNKLPENQRIAITLSKIKGINHKEVAQTMDISVSAVESLIHRGKANLKQLLFKYYNDKV